MSNDSEKSIDRAASVWLEEYKILSSDIMKRIDLQHKNLSLHLVFLSAIAGYLFNYGIKNGFKSITDSEILILVAIAPLVSQVFTWRHIDHDSNIIDKANYIETVVSRNLNRLLKQNGLLGFERYLDRSRKRRVGSVGLFALLGNDHAITITYALVYLTLGWFIIFQYDPSAAGLKTAFVLLMIVSTLLMIATVYMVAKSALRYRAIGTSTAATFNTTDQRDE
jgi:hypothetical protein